MFTLATKPESQPGYRWLSVDKSAMLAPVLILSVMLRLGAVFLQGNTVQALPGIHDQISYHELALRVLDGHGFSFATDWWPATKAGEPTAHWSFLYTLYLSLVYALFDVNPLMARLIQAVVAGVLHPWLTWRIATRLFGQRVGLLAAGICAVYAYFVYYASALMTETFFILAVLTVLDQATQFAANDERRKSRDWALLGLATGCAVLLRQAFLIFVPLLFGWLLWRCRSRLIRTTRGLCLVALILAACILPWTVRNYMAYGHLVLLNSNAGYVLFWSSHPVHRAGFVPILPSSGPSYGELIPPDLLALDEVELDRALFTLGVRQITSDLPRFAWLSVSRTAEYFKFWPTANTGMAGNVARVFSFGILFPFVIVGILTLIKRSTRSRSETPGSAQVQGQDTGADLLALFVLVYTAIHLATWALVRYRLPVDAVFVVYAAVGMLSLADTVKARRFRGSTSPDADSKTLSALQPSFDLPTEATRIPMDGVTR